LGEPARLAPLFDARLCPPGQGDGAEAPAFALLTLFEAEPCQLIAPDAGPDQKSEERPLALGAQPVASRSLGVGLPTFLSTECELTRKLFDAVIPIRHDTESACGSKESDLPFSVSPGGENQGAGRCPPRRKHCGYPRKRDSNRSAESPLRDPPVGRTASESEVPTQLCQTTPTEWPQVFHLAESKDLPFFSMDIRTVSQRSASVRKALPWE